MGVFQMRGLFQGDVSIEKTRTKHMRTRYKRYNVRRDDDSLPRKTRNVRRTGCDRTDVGKISKQIETKHQLAERVPGGLDLIDVYPLRVHVSLERIC
jgi:hypothetical protein